MSLAGDVFRYTAAGYGGIWVRTLEPEDAVDELREMCRTEKFAFYQHGPKFGLQRAEVDSTAWTDVGEVREVRGEQVRAPTTGLVEALAAWIDTEVAYQNHLAGGRDERPPMILAIWHSHNYGEGFVEDIRRVMNLGEANHLHLVFMSHLFKPLELLRPRMAIIEHELPDRSQLGQIANSIATPEDIPSAAVFDATIAAAAGMTRIEAKNAFALSIQDHGRLEPGTVFALKAQMLKTGNQTLVLCTDQEPAGFKDVGGLMYLKEVTKSTLLSRPAIVIPKAKPKGVMLLGVPGAGKSWFARALGREVNMPVLECYLGRARGGIQGQTESNTVEMFRKAERMAPCILFLDEIEKMLSGLKSSGLTDGGVKAGQVGEMLTWMAKPKDVYIVATCNSISAILAEMPEFVREGRFDEIFFLDYPCREAKDEIWKIHLRTCGHMMQYGIKPRSLTPDNEEPSAEQITEALKQIQLPDDKNWTGAEIESCCIKALRRGKPLAEVRIIGMNEIAPETLNEAREWAKGRAYAAEYEGIYAGPAAHARALQEFFNSGNGARAIRRPRGKPNMN